MKRCLFLAIIIALILSGAAHARCNQTNCAVLFYDLGTGSGGISKHSGTFLVDKDLGLVVTPTDFYAYSLDADGAQSEDSPYYEVPGATAGTKNWVLVNGNFGGMIEVFDTSANNDIRLDTAGDSWLNGGNLGIGIATPGYLLDIKSTAENTTIFAITDNDSVNRIFDVGQNTGGHAQANMRDGSDNIDIVFNTNGDSWLNGGDVGIGTASPGALLDVNGDVNISGTTIDMVTSGATLTVGVGSDNGTVSAGVFTDRTKHFSGDALAAINAITGTDGQIDHDSLPSFVQVDLVKPIMEEQDISHEEEIVTPKGKKPPKEKTYKTVTEKKMVKVGEKTVVERDLGAMISVLTVAVQQLTERLEALEAK